MSIILPRVGLSALLREGGRFMRGMDESVLRSIEACMGIAEIVRSSYGPTGMNKVVVSSLEKLFVTNDAATILKELMVEHPAAKLIVMACQEQQREIGDGTNSVVVLTAALLENAAQLLRTGVPIRAVIDGYELAAKGVLDAIESLVVAKVDNLSDHQAVHDAIYPAVLTKQYENASLLTELVIKACQMVLPKNPINFNVDNVRIIKVLGASIEQSSIFGGMAFKTLVQTKLKKMNKVKVVAFSCPFDLIPTETSGKLGLTTAQQLLDYAKGEEQSIEAFVKGLRESGVQVVVTGGKLGDLHVHYLDKYEMMAIKVSSKFELRRLCRSVGCSALAKLKKPTPDEMGYCESVVLDEVGSDELVFFHQDTIKGQVATIILRGSSQNVIDNAERAVFHGINNFRVLTRDNRLLPGGGAIELELAQIAEKNAAACSGIEQFAMERFATALTLLPKQLADNGGLKTRTLLPVLRSQHLSGQKTYGFYITPNGGDGVDVLQHKLYDPFMVRYHAIRAAAEVSVTVLTIDQIIMSKPAEGPQPRGPGKMDADDD